MKKYPGLLTLLRTELGEKSPNPEQIEDLHAVAEICVETSIMGKDAKFASTCFYSRRLRQPATNSAAVITETASSP